MRNLPLSVKLATGICVLTWAVGCGSSGKHGTDGLSGGVPEDAGSGAADASSGPLGNGQGPNLNLGGKDSGADASLTTSPVDASGDITAPATPGASDASTADASGDDASQGTSTADATGTTSDASGDTNLFAPSDANNGLGVDSRAAYCAGSGPP